MKKTIQTLFFMFAMTSAMGFAIENEKCTCTDCKCTIEDNCGCLNELACRCGKKKGGGCGCGSKQKEVKTEEMELISKK